MKKIVFCLFCFVISYSCEVTDNESIDLLKQAQNIAEDDPAKSLSLLDSIAEPERMGEDYYMQYIVAKVQTKYKLYQDITKDSIIVVACKYFDHKDNLKQAALANFYTAAFFHEKGYMEKDLEHSIQSMHYAEIVEDNLLIAKNKHVIGNIYLDKDLMDSAVVVYKQALFFYHKEEGNELHELEIIRSIGISYEIMNELDSAYFYFNEGFELSRQLNNKQFETTFSHLIGMVYRKQGEYGKSVEYLKRALEKTVSDAERIRIYLTLLYLYNDKNQLDSAGFYSAKLIEQLPEIKYKYTLEGTYAELSRYYEMSGNYKEALYYKNLHLNTNKEIQDSKNLEKLKQIEYEYNSKLKEKELDSLRMYSYITWIVGIAVILFIIVISYFRHRNARQIYMQKRLREIEKNKLLKEQLETQNQLVDQQTQNLSYMQSIYKNIINEWVKIEKKVKKLAKEFGATEEPEIYVDIRKVIDNFKQSTNNQLIMQAQKHFKNKPYGEAVLTTLKEKELLLFMLYYCGYKRTEVSLLLSVHPRTENMTFRKLGLRNKLIRAGMPEEEIEEILFAEDERPHEEEGN